MYLFILQEHQKSLNEPGANVAGTVMKYLKNYLYCK